LQPWGGTELAQVEFRRGEDTVKFTSKVVVEVINEVGGILGVRVNLRGERLENSYSNVKVSRFL
jgi:hypothetical protein